MAEINTSVICSHVRFVFDKTLIAGPEDEFDLIDGQWFLIRNNNATLIEGKWDRIKE
jgi:hypothetical protein